MEANSKRDRSYLQGDSKVSATSGLIGITFGTFDLLHIGHVNILRRAKQECSVLIVGVSSDELNLRKKGRLPTYSIEERLKIVESIRYVDSVFVEESLEKKAEYIAEFNAGVLFMGDDWAGKFDHLSEICRVKYFPRTPGISTTEVKQGIVAVGR